MLNYEMPLVLRIMSKTETTAALKRVAFSIFNRGGIIRKIDNLGAQPTPHKMSAHGFCQREAAYFIIHFNAPPRKLEDMLEECGRDIDIIRNRVYKVEKDPPVPCTFHDEMLPPAYRPEVVKLVEDSKTKVFRKYKYTYQFKQNTGLDYYPFQR